MKLGLGCLVSVAANCHASAQQPAENVQQRHFVFTYSGTIKGIAPDARVRVWIPVASDSEHQQIIKMTSNLPVESEITEESRHGNRMIYFELNNNAADEIPFSIEYEVQRNELRGLQDNDLQLDSDARARYLQANRLVPVDGKPLELIADWTAPEDDVVRARQLYDRVLEYMTYDKSVPGYGNGDTNWACDSRTGNCTDFHSLFISLARSQKLPLRFAIGFPLLAERGQGMVGGYHCWASFFVDGKGWTPVDISEADKHPELAEYYFGNLTEDRLTFSSGRDLTLEPPQDGEPLNYFVYPYVEVDGLPLDKQQMELEFRFVDKASD
ncbi:MAG: transglutaminase-like domain-containing protein [Pirellulaceae bacterium]